MSQMPEAFFSRGIRGSGESHPTDRVLICAFIHMCFNGTRFKSSVNQISGAQLVSLIK